MPTSLQKLVAPLLSVFIFVVGSAFFTTLLSLHVHEVSHAVFFMPAVVTAMYFAGQMLGSLLAVRYIQRVGHIRAFATFAAVSTVACLCQAIYQQPWFWIFLRFADGMGAAGLFVVVESWLLALTNIDNRGRVLAVYMVIYYSAQTSGQLLLNYLDPMKVTAFCVVALLYALATIPVSSTRQPSPSIEEPSFLTLKELYRLSPLSIFACLCAGLILGSLYALAPIYVDTIHLSLRYVAWFMGLLIFGGVLLQWPIGRLSDRYGRRALLILVSFVALLLSVGLVILAHHNLIVLLVIISLLGGMVFTLYPLGISHAIDSLTNNDLVAATSGLLIVYGFGSVVGPLLAALTMKVMGAEGLFVYLAVITGILLCFAIWRSQARAAVPVDEQVDYAAVSRTTPMANELDPRLDDEV